MGQIDLANRCKKLRDKLGWSQHKLALALGVTAITVSRWERGDRVRPRKDVLELLRDLEASTFLDHYKHKNELAKEIKPILASWIEDSSVVDMLAGTIAAAVNKFLREKINQQLKSIYEMAGK